MKLHEIRNKIRETLLVQLLPEEMRDRFVLVVLSTAEEDEMRSGKTLFKIGEPDADRGCAILEGMVKVTTADGEVKHLEAPEILGEVQLFTPQAKRTATVHTVLGGPILIFRWQELGRLARQVFSQEELSTLRERISDLADMREKDLLHKIRSAKDTA